MDQYVKVDLIHKAWNIDLWEAYAEIPGKPTVMEVCKGGKTCSLEFMRPKTAKQMRDGIKSAASAVTVGVNKNAHAAKCSWVM